MSERWPALLKTSECCEYLGIGKTQLQELRTLGVIRSVRVGLGACVRYRRTDLDGYIDGLTEARGEPVAVRGKLSVARAK